MSYRKNSRAKLARFMLALSIMGGVGHKMADRSSYALRYATNGDKMESFLMGSAFNKQAGPVYQRFDFNAYEIGKKDTAETLTLVDMILSNATVVNLNEYEHDGKGTLTQKADYPLESVKNALFDQMAYPLTSTFSEYNVDEENEDGIRGYKAGAYTFSDVNYMKGAVRNGVGDKDIFLNGNIYRLLAGVYRTGMDEFISEVRNKINAVHGFIRGLVPRKTNKNNNAIVSVDDTPKSYLYIESNDGVVSFKFIDPAIIADDSKNLSDDELIKTNRVVLASSYELDKSCLDDGKLIFEFNSESELNKNFTFKLFGDLTNCLRSKQESANVFTFGNGDTLYKVGTNQLTFALVPMLFAIQSFKSVYDSGNNVGNALQMANGVYHYFLDSNLANERKIRNDYSFLLTQNSILSRLSENDQKSVLDTVLKISHIFLSNDLKILNFDLLNGIGGISSVGDVKQLMINMIRCNVPGAFDVINSALDTKLNPAIMELLGRVMSVENSKSPKKHVNPEVHDINEKGDEYEIDTSTSKLDNLDNGGSNTDNDYQNTTDLDKPVNDGANTGNKNTKVKFVVGMLLGFGMVGGAYAGYKTGAWKKLYKNLKDRIDAASNRNKKASGPNISHSN